jgi:hypothetical protein
MTSARTSLFHDKLSESLYGELPDTSSAALKAFLDLGRFEIAQSYVTAKVQNRFGDTVRINIEGGRTGIELQETLFNLAGKRPRIAYVVTTLPETRRMLIRKLPVIGVKDWLLIYEDELFLLAVKDAYDELDIRVIE